MLIRIQKSKRRSLLSKMAYSMVELLVAMAVLGVMFVSLYSGFSAGFAIIELARENLRATQILQEKMETIRLYTWDQVNTPGFIPTNFVESFLFGVARTRMQTRADVYRAMCHNCQRPDRPTSYSNESQDE